MPFNLRTSRRVRRHAESLPTRDRQKFEEIRSAIKTSPFGEPTGARVRARLVSEGYWQCVYAAPSFPLNVFYTVDEDASVIEIIRLFPRDAARREVDTP